MRTFDAPMIAALTAETARIFVLLDIGFSTPLYFCNADVPLYCGSQSYLPRPFQITDVAVSAGMAVDRIEVEVENVSQVMSAAVLSEDVRGSAFSLKLTSIDTDFSEIGTVTIFQGQVCSIPTLDEQSCVIEVVNEIFMWAKKSLRPSSGSCPWPFKGTECAYAGGETWCDQSYDRCVALSNSDQFGGFRYLPRVQEKEIWWGRNPS